MFKGAETEWLPTLGESWQVPQVPENDAGSPTMKTRAASTFPGSSGLFSPRWSPDGRYLTATSAEGSHKLMLYDFRTQKWSEWLTGANNINYQYWSSDSRYIYYDNFATDHPMCHRIKVGETRPEDLFSLSGLRAAISDSGDRGAARRRMTRGFLCATRAPRISTRWM
jgi:Tol biopolymer transport system component